MTFQWDENKNQTNIQDHETDFDDAKNVFLDPFRTERIDDGVNYGEVRFQTIGMVDGRMLFVVYTYENGDIRLISARKAEPYERRKYHESDS